MVILCDMSCFSSLHWRPLHISHSFWLNYFYPPDPVLTIYSKTCKVFFITKLHISAFVPVHEESVGAHGTFSSPDSPLWRCGEQQVYQECRELSPAITAWRCSKRRAGQVCPPGCRWDSDRNYLQKKRSRGEKTGKVNIGPRRELCVAKPGVCTLTGSVTIR